MKAERPVMRFRGLMDRPCLSGKVIGKRRTGRHAEVHICSLSAIIRVETLVFADRLVGMFEASPIRSQSNGSSAEIPRTWHK